MVGGVRLSVVRLQHLADPPECNRKLNFLLLITIGNEGGMIYNIFMVLKDDTFLQ
jgi:hypothetical protein